MQNHWQPDPKRFLFRGQDPAFSLGTASDRYAGWMGQIYSDERGYPLKSRTRRFGGRSLRLNVLPISSTLEYFQHFEILELDFTFYSLLVDGRQRPTPAFHTLEQYARYLRSDDAILLKAPQMVFAKKVWRNGAYVDNEHFGDVDLFANHFFHPARQLLGESLKGILFEQEYQKKAQRTPVPQAAEELGRFFQRLPSWPGYHVELRTGALLSRPLLQTLDELGIGLVLSHWTWLPRLIAQYRRAGRFLSAAGEVVVRLLTPRGVRYENAFLRAHPFDALIDGMASPEMIPDTVELVQRARHESVHLNIIVNNRAAGNAPLLARQLVMALESRDKGSGRPAREF